MKTYVTTNLRLDASLYEQLKRIALERRMSLSALFREMAATVAGRRARIQDDPLWQLGSNAFDAGADAPSDIAANHDQYLYGEHRRIR